MRPTTYSDGMTQVSGGVPQLRRDPAQLPPLAGRPDVPGLVMRQENTLAKIGVKI
jgi:hypothetical protein